jgi:heme/copper-type cytochrome/quinol oxidase subunit 2
MHFSTGQISFIIFFILVFVLSLIWSYRKDKGTNKKYYGGAWKVLISLILILAAVSFILKNLRHD